PYLQPGATPAGAVFLTSYLLLAAFSAARIARYLPDRREALVFGAGLSVWTACGAFDIATLIGLVRPVPMAVMEYGFAALAVALVATDVRRYGVLLRRAEESRDEILESFKLIIECTPIGMLVHGKGRVLYANPACLQILGYTSAPDIVGTPVLDLVHGEDRDTSAKRIADVLQLRRPLPHRDTRMLRRDGTIALVDITAVPFVFAGDPAVLAMAQDVTEQRSVAARTMEMDRMIAVGTLAAGVAHEINNPLAYVIANIDFVATELTDLSTSPAPTHPGGVTAGGDAAPILRLTEALRALQEARGGADRVRNIVRDLRVFSREETDAHVSIDLVQVIDSAINIAWNEVRHRSGLVRDFRPVPAILGSRGKLGQVVVNLVVNAAQAIPEGHADENEIRVATFTDARGWAVLEVSDTGGGVPARLRSRVFDPFFTTKPPGQGTGLGLSICQGIVRAHGGEIAFDFTGSRGTTVRVEFPPAPSVAEAPARSIRPPRGAEQTRRMRVLVVDDEPLVVRSLVRSLRGQFDVTTANSGAEALDHIASDPRFDGLLCDLMMPSMTGMQLHDEIQRRDPRLAEHMVFITGGAFTPEARAFLDRAPNERVEKPYEAAALRAVLLRAIGESLAPEAPAP
ncbi:MAG: ATP-binding protein, partial [Deltaproteobacteria bacterium]